MIQPHERQRAFLDAVNNLPDDGVSDELFEQISQTITGDAEDIFKQETAGHQDHPADLTDAELDYIFMEKIGMLDVEGNAIPATDLRAAGLDKLLPSEMRMDEIDLLLHYANELVPEYDNPFYYPSSLPWLFGRGIGGPGEGGKDTPLSFEKHLELFLDLKDRAFAHDEHFIAVAANQLHRRKMHLHTSLKVKRSHFASVAADLSAIELEQLTRVSDYV